MIRRWHGRVKVSFKATNKGGKVILEVYSIKIGTLKQKKGFGHVWQDVIDLIDLEKNKIGEKELDLSIKRLFRKIQLNKWV